MRLTPSQIAETIAARDKHGLNYAAMARELGLARSTVQGRIAQIARIEQPTTYEAIHGANAPANGEFFQVPEGHVVKGVSALVDMEGRTVQQWIKTREEIAVADVIEAIKTAFVDYEGRGTATPSPPIVNDDLLTLYPLSDWHIGLFAWHEETGTNWDLKIAERTIGQGFVDLVDQTPRSKHAVVLGGGDMLHADNQENKTARSGNQLDVDGRYQKVIGTACRLLVKVVEQALSRHESVTVRILKGNHDEHSSTALVYFLMAWFRNEPRVTVDADPSLFFWHRFEKVMLGATHGHEAKAKDMPSIMAHRRAEDWGASRFRYVHTFHLHHTAKTVTEGNGCVTEIHQTPTPQDAWHFGSGFLSGRSLQSISYHRSFGEISRSRVAIMDASS